MESTDRQYREHCPGAELRPYVECFWTSTHPGRPGQRNRHVVLPDGCMDVLFEFSGNGAKAFVIGTMTRPLHVATRGAVRLAAVRFRPGGAYPFLRRPISEWTDDGEMLDDVWPTAARWLDEMGTAARSDSPDVLVDRLRSELVQALPRLTPLDASIRAAIDTVWQRPETRIADLSGSVGVSRQHLTRQIRKTCGIGPKRLARVARVRRLIENPPRRPVQDWARAALDAGYYDQSHMIAEFRELVGETPARFFRTADW